MAGVVGTLIENPLLATTIAAGGIAGGVGGAFLGTSLAGTIALSGGLAAVGLVGGAVGGHYINRYIDKNTPTPMGMKPVSPPAMEAGKNVEVSFKPSVVLADQAYAAFKTEAKNDPAFAEVAKQVPAISQMMAYGRMKVGGTVSQDGTSLEINTVTYTAPFQKDTHIQLKKVSIPLKDGKIDQNDPAAKEAMQQIMYQTIEQRVPSKLQEKAKASVDTLLSKADAEPDTPTEGKTSDKLLKGAKLALTMIQPDTPEDKFVNPNSKLPTKSGSDSGRTFT